jgi:drug/metabolite transporter (DMT)-like permease
VNNMKSIAGRSVAILWIGTASLTIALVAIGYLNEKYFHAPHLAFTWASYSFTLLSAAWSFLKLTPKATATPSWTNSMWLAVLWMSLLAYVGGVAYTFFIHAAGDKTIVAAMNTTVPFMFLSCAVVQKSFASLR